MEDKFHEIGVRMIYHDKKIIDLDDHSQGIIGGRVEFIKAGLAVNRIGDLNQHLVDCPEAVNSLN